MDEVMQDIRNITKGDTTSEHGDHEAPFEDEPDYYGAENAPKIYIMGLGSIGLFMAYAMKSVPLRNAPNIILLTHKKRTRDRWNESSRQITCEIDGETYPKGYFDMEVAAPNWRYHGSEVKGGHPLPKDSKKKAQEEGTFQVTPEDFAERERGGAAEQPQMRAREANTKHTRVTNIGDIPSETPDQLHQEKPEQVESATEDGPPKESEEDFREDLTPEQRQALDRIDKIMETAEQIPAPPPDPKTPPEQEPIRGKHIARSSDDTPILHLVLTVKAPDTVSALSALAHRLSANSTILFIHNGVGIIDEVNEKIFPDPSTRPLYLLGVISHGVTKHADDLFSIIWAGRGTLAIGAYPSLSPASPSAPLSTPRLTSSAKLLLHSVTRVPSLQAAAFPTDQLLALQLEKLAVNCVVNPLTALLDCRNGFLPYSYPLIRVSRLLISEISLVLRNLPALQHMYSVQRRFSPRRLEALWVGVAERTGQNISSMLQDVRMGRGRTEIRYMNGWVAKMGEKLGVVCVTNYGVEKMVEGKSSLVQWEKDLDVPFTKGLGIELREALGGREEKYQSNLDGEDKIETRRTAVSQSGEHVRGMRERDVDVNGENGAPR